MQFLGIAKPKAELFARGLPSDFQDLVLQEQEKARSIYADGVLRQIWQRDDGNGAVALFEAHSMEHMLTILSSSLTDLPRTIPKLLHGHYHRLIAPSHYRKLLDSSRPEKRQEGCKKRTKGFEKGWLKLGIWLSTLG